MDSYFLADAASVPPAFSEALVKGFPQDGDPAIGQRATKPGAYLYYAILEEMLNVIRAAGIEPDPKKLDQMAQAIKKLATREATEKEAGIARIATAAEVKAGEDDGLIITPSKLANALLPTWNGVLNPKDSGYVRFPGGALIQWASDSRNIGGQPTVVTFPLPFAYIPCVVLSAFQSGILDTSAYLRQRTPTTFTFVAMNNGEITPNTNGVGVFWLAIGEGA